MSHGAPIKVMILDGQSGGAYHNWRLTTPVLRKELEDTGLFEVTVVTAPASDQDFSGFEPNLGHYKAIVMNYDAPDWPAEMRARFEKYVSDGGGLVIVHATDNAFPNWPAFNEMAGIGGWRNRDEKLVHPGRQAGVRSHAGDGGHARQPASLPGDDTRGRASHHEGIAAGVDAYRG